jgi:ribosomal protein L7/L12
MNWDKFLDALDPNELADLQQAFKARGGNAGALSAEEMSWLRSGDKIKAIKSVRDRLNLSLQQAVDLVNKLLRNGPAGG